MTKVFAFGIGILVGIILSVLGFIYLPNNNYWIPPALNACVKCDTIFSQPDTLPRFVGGNIALLEYSFKHFAPLVGKSIERTGNEVNRLIYSLTVSDKGEVIDAEILTEIEKRLKFELETELLKMPKWIPGEIDEQAVCAKFRMPISCIKWE